jgi:hypothetical protein
MAAFAAEDPFDAQPFGLSIDFVVEAFGLFIEVKNPKLPPSDA